MALIGSIASVETKEVDASKAIAACERAASSASVASASKLAFKEIADLLKGLAS